MCGYFEGFFVDLGSNLVEGLRWCVVQMICGYGEIILGIVDLVV